MALISKFEGRRSRGIVWVCDIVSSSKYLNNNESAEALEVFLQRLLFISMIFVEAAGGKFVKWTGDGFLAWFETPLLRNLGEIGTEVFNAAWNLTFYVNVSQLGVPGSTKFKIRHAITLEHDALVLDLAYSDKAAMDVLGRAVVLAFRLSSIKADFPSIVTQGELVRNLSEQSRLKFRKLGLSRVEKLKYFKDEKWGTRDLFASRDTSARKTNLKKLLAHTKRLIQDVEGGRPLKGGHVGFTSKVESELLSGPDWCQSVQNTLSEFVRKELLGSLKNVLPYLEERAKKGLQSDDSARPTSSETDPEKLS